MTFAVFDVETRSACDLNAAGVDVYCEHPSTGIWMFCYCIGDGPVHTWYPGNPEPHDLLQHIAKGGEFVAHNAYFDATIWCDLLCRRFYPHWPLLRVEQINCTMARANALQLPPSLHECGLTIGLPLQKDLEGRRLMLQMCRPRRIERDGTIVWWDDPEKISRLADYCRRDVAAERALHKRLLPLPDIERQMWIEDYRINKRGMRFDMANVARAKAIVDAEVEAANRKLCSVTTGIVDRVTATQSLVHFVQSRGVKCTSVDKEHVEDLLDGDLPPDVRQALELRQVTGKSSVAKLTAIDTAVNADHRARGMYTFMGASGTGRWCLTGDHEILTPQGWQRLDSWPGGRLMCWSENGRMGFETATASRFPYSGDLICFENARFQQQATPEHRMPVIGVLGGLPVSQINRKTKMPRHGAVPCSSRYCEAQLRFFVMLQADGCYTKDGTISFKFAKARKITRCQAILRWLGVFSYCNQFGNTTRFVIPRREVKPWMLALGPHKEFPWELLYADHVIFFDEIEHWDAYRCGPQSLQYSTTNSHNADFVQAKAHIANLACNVVIKGHRNDNWNTQYCCNIWLAPTPHQLRKEFISYKAFSGDVFCPSTLTGYFLVRRNGVAWITGNSGRRVQPQNLPRVEGYSQEQIAAIIDALQYDYAAGLIGHAYGAPLDALSQCLRAMIVPDPGNEFIGGDYSQIEARVLPWLAGEDWVLDAFREYDAGRGPDIYKLTYANAYNVPLESVTPYQRQLAKPMRLSLGYGGGFGAFKGMAKGYKIKVVEHSPDGSVLDRPKVERIKEGFRESNPATVQFWYDLDDTAKRAITCKERRAYTVPQGSISYRRVGSYLFCRLPSGRCLSYVKPRVEWWDKKWPDGSTSRMQSIFYYGQDPLKQRFTDLEAYGGKLSAHVTQATARDILRSCMLRLAANGYPVVLHSHDEPVSEVPAGRADPDEFKQIMLEREDWMGGLPIAASKPWISSRYVKG